MIRRIGMNDVGVVKPARGSLDSGVRADGAYRP